MSQWCARVYIFKPNRFRLNFIQIELTSSCLSLLFLAHTANQKQTTRQKKQNNRIKTSNNTFIYCHCSCMMMCLCDTRTMRDKQLNADLEVASKCHHKRMTRRWKMHFAVELLRQQINTHSVALCMRVHCSAVKWFALCLLLCIRFSCIIRSNDIAALWSLIF